MTPHTKAMGATFLLVSAALGLGYLVINYPEQASFAGACAFFTFIAGMIIYGVYKFFYNSFDPNYEPPRHY